MDKLLRKIGLNDTRHELKQHLSSSETKSASKKQASQNLISERSNIINSNSSWANNQSITMSDQFIRSVRQSTSGFMKGQNFKKQSNQKNQLNSESKREKSRGSNVPIQNTGSLNLSTSSARKNIYSSQIQSFQVQSSEKRQQIRQDFQQKQNQKIQQLLVFLRQRLTYKCNTPNHQRNKLSYLCLQINCQTKIGCSYCFLNNHENHLKTQITTCIKDLEELNFKVKASDQLFSKKVKFFYQTFVEKLDSEIKKIKDQFQSNLSFLKMKVKSEFESHYRQKYFPYLSTQIQKIYKFQIPSKEDTTKNQIYIQKTVTKIETSNKNIRLNDTAKQKELLKRLGQLDMNEVYLYLLKRSEVLHLQSVDSKILLQFFEEMNNSISLLFSSFKRNLPKIFTQRIALKMPEIIS